MSRKHKFDRLVHFDERSKAYPIRTIVGGILPRSYTWRHVQLDQGNTSGCTGFAATMEAAARPVPVFGDPAKFDEVGTPELNRVATKTYRRAKVLDEWPGEDYEGSSVLAGMKAGQENGWWDEYRWALGPGPERAANDVMMAVGHHGPVVMGAWWYEAMFEPDAGGWLRAEGEIVGGHAFLLTAFNLKRDAVFTPNSWGGEGQGWINRPDLVKLLADEGEAVVPLHRTKP